MYSRVTSVCVRFLVRHGIITCPAIEANGVCEISLEKLIATRHKIKRDGFSCRLEIVPLLYMTNCMPMPSEMEKKLDYVY